MKTTKGKVRRPRREYHHGDLRRALVDAAAAVAAEKGVAGLKSAGGCPLSGGFACRSLPSFQGQGRASGGGGGRRISSSGRVSKEGAWARCARAVRQVESFRKSLRGFRDQESALFPGDVPQGSGRAGGIPLASGSLWTDLQSPACGRGRLLGVVLGNRGHAPCGYRLVARSWPGLPVAGRPVEQSEIRTRIRQEGHRGTFR